MGYLAHIFYMKREKYIDDSDKPQEFSLLSNMKPGSKLYETLRTLLYTKLTLIKH